ncbi:DUF2069 domain-containing protein [Pseudoxanthomonas putridarboris]|uniref:DUF2069 domain-containing protein n=2 Tax=Pseudoxanthomonas putridarboris TaxID=752605 RepID=A0ABU9J343_9GAMM
MDRSRAWLAAMLLALAALYAVWFLGDRHYTAVLLVFCLPPVLLSLGVLVRRTSAAFWAGVFALFWFAHAVMVAWSRPAEAGYAWGGIVLSVGIVLATSWPALRGRFRKKA